MSGRVGALLIHGLGGTQYDLGSMHKILAKAGVETHAITLAGHGTTPEDLAGVRAEQWIDAVVAQYRELQPQYDQLHIMGMCMGALVALVLAERVQHGPAQGKLVTLAPPIYIDGWSTPWYAALRKLFYFIPGLATRMKVEEGEPFGIKNTLVRAVVKAKFERGDNFHYRWVPLICVKQVDRLRGWAMAGAKNIKASALVVHAREDELTSLRSAEFLREQIADTRVVVLENSYHMICVDNDRDQVANSVLEFFGYPPQEVRVRRRERAAAAAPE
ncbi:alpha/beta hydrolase [Herbaspirillum robiniae]|uniref:Alpha/beta fold hydrolase n=1 Tax=Herbaspirillum robiniae TaxID=2014887 RepID=A0A246WUJ6_9BURK|nr:alpha/beta fold hydrolase [Herbaspirillum robiniae]NUT99991.1 alpha/beta fold hydrolase [Herbaspirillum robiniae]OWY30755.1 esterase [Herbaspirillum robiniae]